MAKARMPVTWRVCQGSYGIVIVRSDKPFPGGKRWEGFKSRNEAEAAAFWIGKGQYRPPDKYAVELVLDER